MTHKIKFCPSNFEQDMPEIIEKVKQFPDVQVIEGECANYCGQCIVQPFTLINGKNIVCDSVEELYPKIIEYLDSLKEKDVLSNSN